MGTHLRFDSRPKGVAIPANLNATKNRDTVRASPSDSPLSADFGFVTIYSHAPDIHAPRVGWIPRENRGKVTRFGS